LIQALVNIASFNVAGNELTGCFIKSILHFTPNFCVKLPNHPSTANINTDFHISLQLSHHSNILLGSS
jgi:hypothetical protein